MADGAPIVIVHGWSDRSAGFERLAGYLSRELRRPTHRISLIDWVSLDDDVRYEDLADGLDLAWREYGLARTGRNADVVLHGAGALVVRTWLARRPELLDSPPIKRLLMLAPANFGSPLAHHGRAVAGRARVGFRGSAGNRRSEIRGAFEPAAHLLAGLELASPFTRDLAMRDRFGEPGTIYGAGRVLCTVLIGNEGNVLLAPCDGSDGVVRTSSANMNCARAALALPALPAPGQERAELSVVPSSGRAAFRVINGFDHAGITLNDARLSRAQVGAKRKRFGVSQHDLLSLMARALTVDDGGFGAWCDECEALTREQTETLDRERDDEVHGHTSLVVRVRNQYDQPVGDYALELYDADEFDERGRLTKARSRSLTRTFQRYAIDDVHTCAGDPSMRCFHIDCGALHARITPELRRGLSISVTATPLLLKGDTAPRHSAGYYGLADGEIGHALIAKHGMRALFAPHRTVLLDVTLERRQAPHIVTIAPSG